MNTQEITLVQASFDQVRPIEAIAATLFYERLFILDPSLKPMFKGDMVHQGRMLMSMLSAAVNGLTNLDALVPTVMKLGARHTGYGVRDEHYATVGEALLHTLEKGLGEQFTPEVRDAWISAYTILASTMQAGAKEHHLSLQTH
jgi:hemoglobin-like flavoprotein